jgi:signal transduction histidine kinase
VGKGAKIWLSVSMHSREKRKKKEMKAQHPQVDERLKSEVLAAQRDMAQLSQYGTASSAAPDAIATALLERLLLLCSAQGGALLLTTPKLADRKHSVLASFTSRKEFHLLVAEGMSEEEALAHLLAFSSEGAALPSPAHQACWLPWKLPVSLPLPGHREQDDRQERGEASEQTRERIQAFLILAWADQQEGSCARAVAKGQTILPLVAEVVATVLSNTLLVERVAELETLADARSLREMDLLKAELLATVSHELRSPLASVKGYAATLLRHDRRISRQERHEFLLAITKASDRLAVVIDRLLEISQLDTDALALKPSTVDLAYLVREALTASEERFNASKPAEEAPPALKRYTFQLHLEDRQGKPCLEVPLMEGDRHRLREVLDHLLENAVLYSPAGGPVEVVIRPVVLPGQAGSEPAALGHGEGRTVQGGTSLSERGPQQMMEMCVRDHGIGIPPEQLERIFENFHRLDTRLTREVNGLGLGLAICKRIVELHGGTIWAESQLGLGSTFHVRLPVEGKARLDPHEGAHP